MTTKQRELEAMQGQIDEQINQITYELMKARDSSWTLSDYIVNNRIGTPQMDELRRTADCLHHILDSLIDTIGNAPSR